MEAREGYTKTELGWIPEDWDVVKLGDACDVRDGTHYSPKYHNDGIPFITSKNLKHRGVDFSDIKYISEQDHMDFSKRSHVENGDILFGMIGTVGNPVIVQADFEFSIKNVALIKMSNNTKINNKFLLAVFNSDIVSNQFKKISNGGVLSFVALGAIRNLFIPLLGISEQQKIAEILTTVDDKISSIEDRIQQTEQLKKGLMEKLLTEGIGHTEFKDTEIGRMPASWDVVQIKDIGNVITGNTPPTSNKLNYNNGIRLWASPADLVSCQP